MLSDCLKSRGNTGNTSNEKKKNYLEYLVKKNQDSLKTKKKVDDWVN